MKSIYTTMLFVMASFFILSASAQTPTPFIGCPNNFLSVSRGGTNTYLNNPVTISRINPVTGAATTIAGGPLKDPSNTNLNIDINAAGVNTADGYMYAMNPTITATPRFYRIGSNYGIQQVGVVDAPAANFPNVAIVNSAAGEFDLSGNYYFTALRGTLSFPADFTPNVFYIGKIANAAALPAGTGTITPTYTAISLSNMACAEYVSTIMSPVSILSTSNTGVRDLAFNSKDGLLYTYVSYEYPAGSGIFKGQLISVNPVTGMANCYPSTVLPFASSSNEVAGVGITFTGDLEVLFTGGSLYKAVSAASGVYTGAITLLNATTLNGPLRGDLASCGGATAGPTPVLFEGFTATENKCTVNFKWITSQEVNVNHYEIEIQNGNSSFAKAGTLNAVNTISQHTYTLQLPVTGKNMIARIKSVDNDGKITYSSSISINTQCAGSPSILILNSYEINSNLSVRWNNISAAGSYTVTVFNTTGASLLRQTTLVNAGLTNTLLDVQKLPAGMYLLVAQNSQGEKFTASFVKK